MAVHKREKKTDWLKDMMAYLFQNGTKIKEANWQENLQMITHTLRVSQTGVGVNSEQIIKEIKNYKFDVKFKPVPSKNSRILKYKKQFCTTHVVKLFQTGDKEKS